MSLSHLLLTVKDLLNTIPSLNDKISEVENLTSQFTPISNISENIKKIKDLIEQARDAANRVRSHSVKASITKHKVKANSPLFCLHRSNFPFFMSLFQIVIPMKFTGEGHVEMRTPKNLDDLKAYTSLSLKLQRPPGRGDGRRRRQAAGEGNMFVLYLGNRDVSDSKSISIV